MALAKHPRCALETRTGDAAVGCIPTLIFTLHPVPSFLSWLECSLAAEQCLLTGAAKQAVKQMINTEAQRDFLLFPKERDFLPMISKA